MPGPLELMVILIVALVVLGPKRLPDAARSFGKGLREFKETVTASNPLPRDEDDDVPEALPQRTPEHAATADHS